MTTRTAVPIVKIEDYTDLLVGRREGEQVVEVPLSAIAGSSPVQTRAPFDPEGNEDDRNLVESIRNHGVIVPVVLGPLPDKTERRYYVIAGHRRVAASWHAGRGSVPAVVRSLQEIEAAEISIIENLQRAGLNPLEQARQYEAFMRLSGLNVDGLAARLNVSRRGIYYFLALLKLPAPVQQYLADGRLNPRQAQECIKAPEDKVGEVVEAAIAHQLSAAGIERVVALIQEAPATPVSVLAEEVAAGRTPGEARVARRGVARSHRKTGGDDPSVDYRRYTTALDAGRRASLEEMAREMRLDVVTVRRAALLLAHDPRLVTPSAVAYAQQLEQTEVGRALARIEAAVARMWVAVHDGLTPSQSKAATLVLQCVKEWADEMIAALGHTAPVVRTAPGEDKSRAPRRGKTKEDEGGRSKTSN